jgi:DnaJ-class molecular chaperone
MSELAIVAETLSRANSYFNVFGELEGDSDNQEHQVKKVYRRLARVLHPDLYAGTPDEQKAEEAFTLLTDYYDQAKDAIANHVYGRKPHVVVRTKRHEHEIGDLVERGDMTGTHWRRSTGFTLKDFRHSIWCGFGGDCCGFLATFTNVV